MSLLLRAGIILTMNDRFDVVEGDVSIKDGRIAAVGSNIAERHDRVVEARGGYILPGFIQTHIHLCQTLFRGFADDLPLMEWPGRAWPMEAAHSPPHFARQPARHDRNCWRAAPLPCSRWKRSTTPTWCSKASPKAACARR
jgi:cytosine/adenosine deaminase-related metal-dependent hydrolase